MMNRVVFAERAFAGERTFPYRRISPNFPGTAHRYNGSRGFCCRITRTQNRPLSSTISERSLTSNETILTTRTVSQCAQVEEKRRICSTVGNSENRHFRETTQQRCLICNSANDRGDRSTTDVCERSLISTRSAE